jgi:hypothetical protein
MKRLYIKCLFIGILSLLGIKASAFDCKLEGVFYSLNTTTRTATVTYYAYKSDNNSSAYSGDITIP